MYSSRVDQFIPESTNTFTLEDNSTRMTTLSDSNEYTFVITDKILVVAIVVFFIVVLFVICLHMHAEWILNHALDMPQREGAPGPFFSFWAGNSTEGHVVTNSDDLEMHAVAGLDKSVLVALPTFRYKTTERSDSNANGILECAICLVNFEEDDVGRSLPRCGHSFHIECIDLWLDSHWTCPLCRVSLEPSEELESQQEDSVMTGISEVLMRSMVSSRRSRQEELSEQIIPTQVVRNYHMYENSNSHAEQLLESEVDVQLVYIAQGEEAGSIPSDTPQRLNEDLTFSAAFNVSFPQVEIDIDILPTTCQIFQVREHAPSDGI